MASIGDTSDGPYVRAAPYLLAVLSLLATAVVYAPAVRGGFVFDDYPNIVAPSVLHWTSWSVQGVWDVLHHAALPNRPVANLTFAANHLMGGLEPGGYHVVNITLHMFVGGAIATVAWLLARDAGLTVESNVSVLVGSILCAAVFLLHPLATQTASYVVQRMTLLATLFSVSAFGFYLMGRRRTGRGRHRVLALSGCMWMLGIGCKEIALPVPLIAMIYEATFRRAEWKARLKNSWVAQHPLLVGLAGVALLIGLLLLLGAGYGVLGGLGFAETLPGREFTSFERILTQPRVHLLYVKLFLFPFPEHLALDRDFDISHGLTTPWTTLPAMGVWLFVTALGVSDLFRGRLRSLPWCSYLLLHAIESGPLNLELSFEHRMYMPMAFVAAAGGVLFGTLNWGRRIPVVATALLLATALGFSTYKRNLVWADEEALLRDCVAKASRKSRTHFNLGKFLGPRGHIEEARSEFAHAVRLAPGDGQARSGLAKALQALGRDPEAHQQFKLGARLSPKDPIAIFNYAESLYQLHRYAEAFSIYERFLHMARSQVYAQQRKRAVERARSARNQMDGFRTR